jgi:hypothetical protein
MPTWTLRLTANTLVRGAWPFCPHSGRDRGASMDKLQAPALRTALVSIAPAPKSFRSAAPQPYDVSITPEATARDPSSSPYPAAVDEPLVLQRRPGSTLRICTEARICSRRDAPAAISCMSSISYESLCRYRELKLSLSRGNEAYNDSQLQA